MPRPSSLCTSQRAPETAKSPLLSSPSTSPSSPFSPPSSPSSPSSTSPRRMGTGYHEDKDGGHAGDNRVSKAAGDGVSSTSSSLKPSSLSLPQSSSLSQSQCLASPPLPYGSVQKQDVGMEIYDPFQPTEGDGIPGMAEDEEGDKYDPFEPTGSPGSEKDDDEEEEEEEEREMNVEQEEEGSIHSEVKDADEADFNAAAEAEGPPPDSTETLGPPLASDDASAVLDDMRDLKEQMRERRKSSRDRRVDDSEHSEIEEGEIVGAGESIREREIEIRREVLLPSPGSPSFLQGGGLKPERILRVLDGEDFVSVRAEGEWDREPVPPIGMGDLRRKLTNRRKQRFRSCPSSASLSPPPVPMSLPIPSPSPPVSPLQSIQKSRSCKSSKSSKERERRKRKGQDKDKRKKRKDLKADSGKGSGESKDRNQERRSRRDGKERDKDRRRSSRSHSRTRRSTHHSTPDPVPHSHNASRHAHGQGSCSRERDRDRAREKDRERERERDRYKDRRRDDRERDRDSRRRDERKRERDEAARRSSSRERRHAKRRRESSERRERDKERGRERERERDLRRDGRPVVPPSIQDLNGSDLFAIKRTITVNPKPTGMVSSPPSLGRDRTRSPTQGSDKSRKHKRKQRKRSDDEDRPEENRRSRSRPSSPTPLRYHGYESDRLSDHPEPDMLSLDGEALDSDYPSLEDSPLLPPPPPEPLLPSPKPKTSPPKSSRHHQKKKSRSGSKKLGQYESSTSSSSHRPKASKLLSLSASSGNTACLLPPASSSSVKRARKTGKDKLSKKDASRSSKSKKPGGRKAKLQSKVSVLVREGVSSTTGNSSKLGLDLLGPSGPTGPSVVGGSIAVVFRRDNESRSPFLKPCSEPLSLQGRTKDLNKTGKPRNSLGSLSSTNSQGLKSKKVKPSSTTSTSSSASSPTSSSVTKRRRRPGKKPREKGLTLDGPDGKGANGSTLGTGWTGTSADIQPLGGHGPKPSSPPSTLPGPAPSSSSSSSSSTSSTSVLPPSSSPPHTPPLSLLPSRDTRESSPDSQTVDSSCKTPEPSFLLEECPAQSQSVMLSASKSPPSPPLPRGDGMSQSASKPLTPDDQNMSPPCPTSLALGTVSLSHAVPPPVAEPSSSSSASVSSSSVSKPPPPPPPPSSVPPLPWSLQAGVDCTAGGVLALTALLFKMEEANIASRAKAQEFIQATSQILSQANQNQSQTHSSSSSSSQVPPPPPPPPSHAPPPGPTPAQFILHGSLPLVGCNKTQPSHMHTGLSLGGGCAQTPPPLLSTGTSGGASEMSWDNESKDPDKYLKKLHTQERAVEEVKLAIKPYYQRKDINKDEYKDILRKAVHKICHSRTGEINPVKVSNLVKLYVQRYKYFRKHGRKMDEEDKDERESASLHSST